MKKFRTAIIGCGTIFSMHANSIRVLENAELVAVCDNKPERAQEKAKEFNCKHYTNYKEMIDREALDAIHICLPHYLHATAAIYALKARVNVLTEKPMAIELKDAEDMVKAAKDNERTLGVIFQNRYNNAAKLIKENLENGVLGKVIGGKCALTWRRTEEYYNKSDWRGTWDKEGGGVIINQAIHTLDLMRWFVNSEIENIDATLKRRVIKGIEVEDFAEGIIGYKNGIITSFNAMNYYSYDAPVEIELHCEKGLAKMVGDKTLIKLTDGREISVSFDPEETFDYGKGNKGYWGVSHLKQIKNFYTALEAGVKPDITGEEAIKTQRMICEIYRIGRQKGL